MIYLIAGLIYIIGVAIFWVFVVPSESEEVSFLWPLLVGGFVIIFPVWCLIMTLKWLKVRLTKAPDGWESKS